MHEQNKRRIKTKSARKASNSSDSGQKSHHAFRAKLWCRNAFWHGFETKAVLSSHKWKQLTKLSAKAKCLTIRFGSWTLFRKEWTWLALRSNSKGRSLSTRSFCSRKRLSPGMISFAGRTFAWKKNWLKEVKEYFPGFSFLSCFVIAVF